VAGRKVAAGAKALAVPGLKNTLACRLNLRRHVDTIGARNLLLWLELRVKGKPVSDNLVTFSRPKHLELQDPGIRMAVRSAGGRAFTVTLRARRPALWVWLDLRGTDAAYSDRFFHLRPGRPVTIEVSPAKRMTASALKKSLSIRSLFDTYR
jgi:beta-mannosidase